MLIKNTIVISVAGPRDRPRQAQTSPDKAQTCPDRPRQGPDRPTFRCTFGYTPRDTLPDTLLHTLSGTPPQGCAPRRTFGWTFRSPSPGTRSQAHLRTQFRGQFPWDHTRPLDFAPGAPVSLPSREFRFHFLEFAQPQIPGPSPGLRHHPMHFALIPRMGRRSPPLRVRSPSPRGGNSTWEEPLSTFGLSWRVKGPRIRSFGCVFEVFVFFRDGFRAHHPDCVTIPCISRLSLEWGVAVHLSGFAVSIPPQREFGVGGAAFDFWAFLAGQGGSNSESRGRFRSFCIFLRRISALVGAGGREEGSGARGERERRAGPEGARARLGARPRRSSGESGARPREAPSELDPI